MDGGGSGFLALMVSLFLCPRCHSGAFCLFVGFDFFGLGV